jgi:hypothetical protein
MFLGKHGGILGSKKAYEPGNSGATLFARGGDEPSPRGKWLNIQQTNIQQPMLRPELSNPEQLCSNQDSAFNNTAWELDVGCWLLDVRLPTPLWGRAVPTPKKNAQANLRVLRQAKAVRLA